MCNCDGFGELLVDEGIINSTQHLPISQINHGSTNSFGKTTFFVSPLECTGKKLPYRSEYDAMQKKNLIEKIAYLNQTFRDAIVVIEKDLENTRHTRESDLSDSKANFAKECFM